MRFIGTAMITAGMGLAALGVAGPASAAQQQPMDGMSKPTGCRYEVTASALHVREKPQGKIVGSLPRGRKFTGSCKTTRGYVQIFSVVPSKFNHKWVYGRYVKRIPHGGIPAGAGGASVSPDYLMAGAGLGAIALGGGLVLTRRRRVSVDS
ncbi:hypothetical protein Acsp03_37300 [Actinomadura sp. NBRC 104412]|uniref:hypothetical protein n=1 Tax=Actinomadura sp. NBRC 104412 TaxID=3032203 RepID=UPI0024A2659B|nr:hypothetical protein [Actinomadura sp. NBRC 104412]GLZ06264.1 hypothetical protein Acsp03_37300 [Actinomadura sp. NBRC 104412]